MDQMQKAMQVTKAMDTLVAANYNIIDLSPLITVQDGVDRPLLQARTFRNNQSVPAIGSEPCLGVLHSWNEQGLGTADGTTAGYQEGGKPTSHILPPVRISNVLGRFGRTAAVTDTEAAVWTNGGTRMIDDGDLQEAFTTAMDTSIFLMTQEILNEIEWCWVNGNALNNSAKNIPAFSGTVNAPTVSQFNGILQILSGSQTNYGNATIINAANAPYNGYLTEAVLRDAGRKQVAQKTHFRPDMVLVSDGQLEAINSFRPTVITMTGDQQTGGGSVYKFNTGFSTVDVVYEPYLPSGTMVFLVSRLLKNAPLIPLRAEPLARNGTQVERMITTEMSVSVRNQKAHVVITGLNV